MSLEIRSAVHFWNIRKLSHDDCLGQINEPYGPGRISLSAVRQCYIAFGSGKTALYDNNLSGRPVKASISMSVQEILINAPFATARHITENPEQLKAALLKCLYEELGLRKIKFRLNGDNGTDNIDWELFSD
jgi:hypothetical protein